MKVTADTNVLVRAITEDDERQSMIAQAELADAEAVALPTPALCELVWVLSRGYGIGSIEIAAAIRRLVCAANALANQPAVAAGLAFLETGGDFADGVIAYEGNWLGAETFISFDRTAVRLAQSQGRQARLL